MTNATRMAVKAHLEWMFRVTSTRPSLVFAVVALSLHAFIKGAT